MEWTDGGKYEGTWKWGVASGHGKFFYPDGDYYEGNWTNNMANG